MVTEEYNNAKKIKIILPKSQQLRVGGLQLKNCEEMNTTLNTTLDLDAIFAKMSIKKFSRTFKCPIELHISDLPKIDSHDKIKTNLLLHNTLADGPMLRNLPHVKIGYSHTNIGTIDIFLFVKDSYDEIDFVTFKKKIFKYLKKLLTDDEIIMMSKQFITSRQFDKSFEDSFSIIRGQLLPHDTYSVFTYLEEKLNRLDLGLYCEAFGNKNATMTSIDDYQSLIDCVSTVFDSQCHRLLNIDICISVSCQEKNTITFANESFYHKIGISPNFKPLFSNSILNCHYKMSASGSRHEDHILRKYKATKFNFYSTFKNILDVRRIKPYESPATSALFMTRIFHCWVHGPWNKAYNIIDSNYLKSLTEYNSRTSKMYPYRLEARCRFPNAETLIEKFKKLITTKHFSFCDSKEFFVLLDRNLDYLSGILEHCYEDQSNKVLTPGSLIISLLSEQIINNIFITGHKTCSMFNAAVNNALVTHIIRSNYSICETNIRVYC